MFITPLVVLFIIKLRFPKGKSIHHKYLSVHIIESDYIHVFVCMYTFYMIKSYAHASA